MENNEESLTKSVHSFQTHNSCRKFLLCIPVTQEEQQKSHFTHKKSITPRLLLTSGNDGNFSWASSLATPPGYLQFLPGDTDSDVRLKQEKPDRNLKHSFFPRVSFGSPSSESTAYEKPNAFWKNLPGSYCSKFNSSDEKLSDIEILLIKEGDDGMQLVQVEDLFLQNISPVEKEEQAVCLSMNNIRFEKNEYSNTNNDTANSEIERVDSLSLRLCNSVGGEQQTYGSTLKISGTEEKETEVSSLKVDENTDRGVNQIQHLLYNSNVGYVVELDLNKFLNLEKTCGRHVAETQLPNINSKYNNALAESIQHSDRKEGVTEFVSNKTETEKSKSAMQFLASGCELNTLDITVQQIPVIDEYKSCINTKSSKISVEMESESSVDRQASDIYVLEGSKKSLDISMLEKSLNEGSEIFNVKHISKTPSVEVCEKSVSTSASQVPVFKGISSENVMTCAKFKEEQLLDESYRIRKNPFSKNKSVCHSCENISPSHSFECNPQPGDYRKRKLIDINVKQENNILPVLNRNLGFMFTSTLFKKDTSGDNGEEDRGLLQSIWKKKSYEMCIDLESLWKNSTAQSNCYSQHNNNALVNLSGTVSEMINGHVLHSSQLATSMSQYFTGSLSPTVLEGFCQTSEAALDFSKEFSIVEEQKVTQISDVYDNLEVQTQVDNNFKNLNQSGRDVHVDCLSVNNGLIKNENQFHKKTSERPVDGAANFVPIDNQNAYLYMKTETFKTTEPVEKDLTIQDISKDFGSSKQENARISEIDHVSFKNRKRCDQTVLYPSNKAVEPFLYLEGIQYQQENQREDEKSVFSFDEGKEEMFWCMKEKNSEEAMSYSIQNNASKVIKDLYKVLPMDREIKPCDDADIYHTEKLTVFDCQQSFMDTSVFSSRSDKNNLVGLFTDYDKVHENLENNPTVKTEQLNKFEEFSTMDERKNSVSEKSPSFARSLLEVDLITSKTSKPSIEILTNVNEQEFTTASGKEPSVSKASFNFAKCLFNENISDEMNFKPEDKKPKNTRNHQ
ncbi:uncharacterized protein LOC106457504 isoform X2 [Limulus polyphemus]|uniref:Uncharacterized protein LOC106457504 isoform X2 n=1 Tax=Limulus polyphemus TaxID=6850 RepID=A0ABM1S6C7_LIMPO|nr:uncharacterized protein LOC106457504 isoform X2 [Limulus polyphemus]